MRQGLSGIAGGGAFNGFGHEYRDLTGHWPVVPKTERHILIVGLTFISRDNEHRDRPRRCQIQQRNFFCHESWQKCDVPPNEKDQQKCDGHIEDVINRRHYSLHEDWEYRDLQKICRDRDRSCNQYPLSRH